MKKAITLCVLIAATFLAVGVFLGMYASSDARYNKKIVDDFGYLELQAYKAVVKHCTDNHYEQTKCDRLMVRTARPFNEEYGAGVNFVFSTSRKHAGDALTISVAILTSERIWSIEKIDESIPNDNPLP